jgi:hypothetical protein
VISVDCLRVHRVNSPAKSFLLVFSALQVSYLPAAVSQVFPPPAHRLRPCERFCPGAISPRGPGCGCIVGFFCRFWLRSECSLRSPARGRVMPVLISVVLDRLLIPPFVLIDLAFSSCRPQVWLFSTPCFLCWTRQTVFHQGISLSNSVISIFTCGVW